MTDPNIFLSAEWRHLLMLNYEIDPSVLRPLLPAGTELDLWHGKAFVSLVGFMFLNTKVLGFPIPFHRHFEEVNLRFYTKRAHIDGERRGVTFIKEIVPRRGIAFLARHLYNENYIAMPMRHSIIQAQDQVQIEYAWKFDRRWQQFGATCKGKPAVPTKGSDEEFITEHYWGFSAQRDGSSIEYQVTHPQWRIWRTEDSVIDIDVNNLYGPDFAAYLCKPPASSFLAEGSLVTVSKGVRF